MKRIVLLSVLCVMFTVVRAQHILQAEGPMPQDLLTGFEQMYAQDRQRVKDYDQGRLRNKNDVQGSTYAVNQLLTSGRVLYGDPLTQWVNRIADTLLVDYPELRKELRFYVVKSTAVNAYATGQGIIFVNLGLIAQLEDEAQLAWILSHEIVHYQKKHTLQELTRNKRAEATIGRNDELSALMRKHQRSKEMENEADSLGMLQFYLPSAYRKDVCEGVFDVLQYAYLPFDEIPFDTNLFNTDHFRLPSELWLKQTNPISARDDYNDSLSTHPNILKRRVLVASLFDEYESHLCNARSERYLCATPQEFSTLRDMARYEVMRQHLLDFNYARALYEIYLLEREHPADSLYLAQCRAQTLYSMARYRNHSKAVSHPIPDPKEIEGEQQMVYHMLHEISKEHLTILALREEAKLGNTREMEELMHDLKEVCDLRASDFLAAYDTVAPASAQDTAATSSKYARIRKKKDSTRQASPITYAFEGQPRLLERMAQVMTSPLDTTPPACQTQRVLLLDPTYLVFDNLRTQIDYPKSVAQEARLERLNRAALKANRQEMVTLDDSTTQGYNDYMTLMDYLGELSSCIDDYSQHLFTQEAANQVLDRLGVDQLQLMAVANIEGLRMSRNPLYEVVSLVLFPWLPIGIYNGNYDREQTLMAVYNIDARHGRLLSKNSYGERFRDGDALVKQQIHIAQQQATHPNPDHPLVPGYLGRRAVVTLNAQVNPTQAFSREQLFSFLDKIAWGEGQVEMRNPLRVSLTPTLEYVVGPHASIKMTYNYHKDFFSYSYYDWDDNNHYTEFTNDYDIRAHTATFSYTKYRSDCTAPLGVYISYGAQVNCITLNDEPYWRFGFNLEAGRNHIYLDRLVVNFGGGYSIVAGNPFVSTFLDGYVSADKMPNRLASRTAWLSNLVSLRLGIGLLPF